MSGDELELHAASGTVAVDVADEFPGLRLFWLTATVPGGPSPRSIVERLAALSNRFRGSGVIAIRAQPVPRAYRTFYRQIGLDPDVDRPPLEQVALDRLQQGAFRSRGLLADALLVAVIETGVGVWALDADAVAAGGLGIRLTGAGERLGHGEHAEVLPPEILVVADARVAQAVLFGRLARGHEARPGHEAVLFAVAVEGVPSIHAEEALWVCAEVLRAAAPEARRRR